MKKFVTLLVTLLVIASLSFCAVAEDKPFCRPDADHQHLQLQR